jgi:hypothetical protein
MKITKTNEIIKTWDNEALLEAESVFTEALSDYTEEEFDSRYFRLKHNLMAIKEEIEKRITCI